MKNKSKYLSKKPMAKKLPKKAGGGLMGNNNISEYDHQQEINTGRNVAEMVSNINPFVKAGHIVGTNISNALAAKNADGYTDASKGAQFVANVFNPTDSVSRGVGYLKQGNIGQGLNNLFNPFASIKENRKLKQQVEKRKAFEAQLAAAKADFNANYKGPQMNTPVMAKGGWIKEAINPAHKGYCTPMSKPTCTGHRRALAMRFKHGDLSKHPEGGTVTDPEKYDTLIPYRDTYKQYGVDNPEFYKIFNESPQDEVGAYYTVAKELGQGDKFLTNWNNRYAKRTGGWYDPQSTTGLHYVMDKPWVSPVQKPVQQGTVHAGDGFVGTTPAPKLMAYGGMMKPNAELEQGEPYRTPDGRIGMISNEAPTHAEGGVPVSLPAGTEVLGKNDSQYGEQFKVIGQKLKKAQDRYKKVLESRPTEIAKRTAKLMLDKIQGQYDALFAEQEAQKGYHTMPDGSTMANEDMQYAGGGPIKTPAWLNIGSQSNGNGLKLNDLAGVIGEYAPIAYNLATGLKRPKKIDPESYYNPYDQQSLSVLSKLKYDPTNEIVSNQNEQAAYNRGIRGLGLTGNQLASNLASGSINKARANSDVYSRANNINASYAGNYANALAQLGQQRANTKLAVDDLNTREAAAREGTLQAGLSQLSQAVQAGKYKKMQKARDKQKLDLLSSLVQNYSFVNGQWVSKSTGKVASEAEINNYINGN